MGPGIVANLRVGQRFVLRGTSTFGKVQFIPRTGGMVQVLLDGDSGGPRKVHWSRVEPIPSPLDDE